jgi:cephalosporin hydroxylase
MKKVIKKFIPQIALKTYYLAKKVPKKLRRWWITPEDERIRFNLQTVYDGHFKVTYRGISAIRCPFDYVMYQMIICKIMPDLIIDIGTNYGGGTLYMADILDTLGHGMIHSIDIEKKTGELIENHPRIKLFTKGWDKYDINNARGFSKILIIEDASHMYEDSIGALKKFSSLVSVGSYFIVEDGIVNELEKGEGFHGGPLRAIQEFLVENKNFIVDREYCDMFGKNATFSVNGYLKRIH